jgi:hypothetical protein
MKPTLCTLHLILLRIKGLYMFRALLAQPQEALHKRHLVYCVRISVGCATIAVSQIYPMNRYFHLFYIFLVRVALKSNKSLLAYPMLPLHCKYISFFVTCIRKAYIVRNSCPLHTLRVAMCRLGWTGTWGSIYALYLTQYDYVSWSHMLLYNIVNVSNFEFFSRVNRAGMTKTSFLPVHSLQVEVISAAVKRYVKNCMRPSASGR